MNLLKDKNVYIFDLDGTIYRGEESIPGADSIISSLTEKGKIVYLLTNNATKTRLNFVEKLAQMNISVTEDQIVSSGYIASLALAQKPDVSVVYIIGTNELVQLMEAAGVKTLNTICKDKILYAPILDSSITCDAVVTSLDREISYPKIRTAMELINRGAVFYATNSDSSFPENGQLCPGGGVMLAAVQTCVGFPPKEVFGKPNILGLQMILDLVSKKGYSLKDMVLIGDRFETDILQANRMGIDSVFVETGVNTIKDLEKIDDLTMKEEMTPTWYRKSIVEILD